MGVPESLSFLNKAIWQGRIFNGGWTDANGGVQEFIEPATGRPLGSAGMANAADVAAAGKRCAPILISR